MEIATSEQSLSPEAVKAWSENDIAFVSFDHVPVMPDEASEHVYVPRAPASMTAVKEVLPIPTWSPEVSEIVKGEYGRPSAVSVIGKLSLVAVHPLNATSVIFRSATAGEAGFDNTVSWALPEVHPISGPVRTRFCVSTSPTVTLGPFAETVARTSEGAAAPADESPPIKPDVTDPPMRSDSTTKNSALLRSPLDIDMHPPLQVAD